MDENIDINAPISWKVSAIKEQDKITGSRQAVEESICASRDEAITYRDELKANGYIATVTPVFLSPQVRGKVRAKGQERTAPRKFNADWRLHSAGT